MASPAPVPPVVPAALRRARRADRWPRRGTCRDAPAVAAWVETLEARTLLTGPWQDVPDGGTSLLPDGFTAADYRLFAFEGTDAELTVFDIAPADGLPDGVIEGVRVENRVEMPQAWAVQLFAATTGDVADGDTLLVTFFARGSADTPDGWLDADAYLQEAGGDYRKLVTAPVEAGSEWRQFFAPASARFDAAAGGHEFVLHLGSAVQTLEIAGLGVLNYGPDVAPEDLPKTPVSYEGRAADAPWRAEAAAEIDRLRKADLAVTVVDQFGDAVEGAEVQISMTRHEFGFGVAADLRMLGITREEWDGLTEWQRQDATWDDVLRYRAEIENNFNKVVSHNDLKTRPWEYAADDTNWKWRRSWTDRALTWLEDRGFETRGHYGVWGPMDAGFNTGWERADIEADPDGYRRYLFDHLADKLPTYAGRIDEWDAINHPVGWGPDTIDGVLGEGIYAELIAEMRRLDPAAEMWVNEGNILAGGWQEDAFFAHLEDLIARGQPADGIGFMGHFADDNLRGMTTIRQTLDRFATLGVPLQITELDYASFDRGLQADYFGDFLTAAFAHEAVDGVVQWGFWEGRHWLPESSLFEQDWTLRQVAGRGERRRRDREPPRVPRRLHHHRHPRRPGSRCRGGARRGRDDSIG